MKRWALLGASKGLGKSFADLLLVREPESVVFSVSRNGAVAFDFSKEQNWPLLMNWLRATGCTHIVAFAGGGPHGKYAEKQWKDHDWAMKVTFGFPAFLLHSIVSEKDGPWRQLTLIGSAVAENAADPGAASYAAAKHALLGLARSVFLENAGRQLDLRLFSPGYMQTSLLPEGSWPRAKGLAADPNDVAAELFDWLQDPTAERSHRISSLARLSKNC